MCWPGINPTVGVVETVDEAHCVLVTGGDSLEIVAVWIGMLGLDFHVDRATGTSRSRSGFGRPVSPGAADRGPGAAEPMSPGRPTAV